MYVDYVTVTGSCNTVFKQWVITVTRRKRFTDGQRERKIYPAHP